MDVRRIEVEFEKLYQTITPYTTHLDGLQKSDMKAKFLGIFHRYSKVKTTKQTKEDDDVIRNLAKNQEIAILRQDKGRGVVIMDRSVYDRKCKQFLDSEKFVKLDSDPTATFQSKMQRTLLSMKNAFDAKTYKKLYPSSSRPGLFFGLAKVHKVPKGVKDVEVLPLRPVISNIGTATYETSKYLAELLKPLSKSQYTIESTKDFIAKVRGINVPEQYSMMSFDVEGLFTNVPLEFTINVILDKIYTKKLVKTKLKRKEMEKLLWLCTTGLHFTFNGEVYRQIDGVAMGSPLGPVLANVFMVELEERLVPTMEQDMPLWYRYVDDTFTYIKESEIEKVKEILNAFHPSIKFTCEKEEGQKISFLDVLVQRNSDVITTDIYRKKTDTNIYINWNSFSPQVWKIGTLKGLLKRAYVICSDETKINSEIKHLRNVFIHINQYPRKVVDEVIRNVKDSSCTTPVTTVVEEVVEGVVEGSDGTVTEEIEEVVVKPCMVLPYAGKQGESIVTDLKKCLRKYLPVEVKTTVSYTGKKLGSFFRIKDKIKEGHQTNCVYAYDSTDDTECREKSKYVGETNVRYETRKGEHCRSDTAVSTHAIGCGHEVNPGNFKILATGYGDWKRRKLAEALYIRDMKPELNRQVQSHKLYLFN